MSVQTDYYIPQMKIKDETISQMAAEITKLRAERDALEAKCVKLGKATLDVYDFMAEDHKSGDSDLWSIGYSELFDTVNEALDFLADKDTAVAPDAVLATEG